MNERKHRGEWDETSRRFFASFRSLQDNFKKRDGLLAEIEVRKQTLHIGRTEAGKEKQVRLAMK